MQTDSPTPAKIIKLHGHLLQIAQHLLTMGQIKKKPRNKHPYVVAFKHSMSVHQNNPKETIKACLSATSPLESWATWWERGDFEQHPPFIGNGVCPVLVEGTFAVGFERPPVVGEGSFRVIGEGVFAVVFEIPGTRWAFKKPRDSYTDLTLRNEQEMGLHLGCDAKIATRLLQASDDPNIVHITVPSVPAYGRVHCQTGGFIRQQDHIWWMRHGHRFGPVESYSGAAPALLLERISPMPTKIFRDALCKIYFEFETHEDEKAVLKDPMNNHCLIRPFLGRRFEDMTPAQKQVYQPTGLRNFPMCIEQLAEFEQLNPRILAR